VNPQNRQIIAGARIEGGKDFPNEILSSASAGSPV
jgi:hypothetical protein